MGDRDAKRFAKLLSIILDGQRMGGKPAAAP
jgi:hypothetical protein